MAGDWIKWTKGLARRPEVLRLAGVLRRDPDEIAGKLMRFWEWCDDNVPQEEIAENGSAFVTLSPVDGDNMAFVDTLIGTPEFAASLALVGWIHFRGGRIELPNFGRHNGETAKTRARNAKNQKAKRDANPDKPTRQRGRPARTSPKMSPARGDILVTREEERRECSADAEHNPQPPSVGPPAEDPLLAPLHFDEQEPDWLIEESKFLARWNTLTGSVKVMRNAMPPDLRDKFHSLFRTPGWLDHAQRAMRKFADGPLPTAGENGFLVPLQKFINEVSWMEGVANGSHDQYRNRNSKTSKGEVYDPKQSPIRIRTKAEKSA